MKEKNTSVRLTNDPLTNIKLMAPLLDESKQHEVVGALYILLNQPRFEDKKELQKA